MKIFHSIILSIITILLLIITILLCVKNNQNISDNIYKRYTIHSSSGMTILLDKKTGLTYRNIKCEKTDIPNCWQMMRMDDNTLAIPYGYNIAYELEVAELFTTIMEEQGNPTPPAMKIAQDKIFADTPNKTLSDKEIKKLTDDYKKELKKREKDKK